MVRADIVTAKLAESWPTDMRGSTSTWCSPPPPVVSAISMRLLPRPRRGCRHASRNPELDSLWKALFSGVFDGTTDEVRFEAAGSFASRVEKLVEPGVLAQAPDRVAIAALPETTESEEDGREEGGLEGDLGSDAPPSGVQPSAATAAAPGPATAPDMLAGVRIERTADGGLRVEAPLEAAKWMATAFEAMAMLMRAATITTTTP